MNEAAEVVDDKPAEVVETPKEAPKEKAEAPKGAIETTEEVKAPEINLQDYRKAMAGDDDKLLKSLERYRTAEDLGKAFAEKDKLAREKQKPLALGDDATDDQKADYRKALGLTDDATAYPIDFREGYEANDSDAEILGSFKNMLHEQAGDPRTAKMAMEWYQDAQAGIQQERDSALAERADQTQEALRAEYGVEYKGNIEAAQGLMKSQLGEEGYERVLQTRFEDGTRLQDDPDFVKMMVNLGVDYYGSNGIVTGDVETTAKTVDEKISDFRKMQTENPDEYYSAKVQAEVGKLYEQKAKLDARK